MDNLRQFLCENPEFTLWEYLAQTPKPIVIYGMGDGAEKIIAVLEKKGIEYRDIFASDGFVRGHSFHGMRVKSFDEIKAAYGDFIILLAFAAKLDATVKMLYDLSEKYELYAPDVNVSGDYTEVFDAEYYAAHREELYAAMNMFEESAKEIFCRVLDFKISGKLEYLRKIDALSVPSRSYYNPASIRRYADLGAYNGDTLKDAVEKCHNLTDAVLFEPDEKNFKKLCAYAETLNINAETHNNAAWNAECEMTLHMGFGKNTTLGKIGDGMQKKKDKIVTALPLDAVCKNADLIKYDVEGSEYEALEGSKNVILSDKPILVVSAYHNNNDLFRLPTLMKSFYPYKLYLCRKPCIPAWELEIVAVNSKYRLEENENV